LNDLPHLGMPDAYEQRREDCPSSHFSSPTKGVFFMLVLTRKYQEKIRIGDNITITVLRTKGKAVRLGIEAPSDVPVIRGELSFQSEADSQEPEVASLSGTSAGVKRAASRHETTPTWATDPPRQPDGRSRDLQRPQVQLKRMSRGDVAEYLPKLVAGAAPLRSIMEQR
jgi:carbon storage regulator